MAAGWPETGVFALQTLLEENARDTKLLHELARLYHELGESEREVEIYNRISAIDPADAAAMRLGKDASARDSMKSGGWAAAESYRDLIKDKEAAVSLEQQSRMQLTEESLGQQIAEVYAMHEAEPQNVDIARRLGALSEQKDDLDAAIAWYRYASDLTQGSDPGLIRKISDLGVKRDRARDCGIGRINREQCRRYHGARGKECRIGGREKAAGGDVDRGGAETGRAQPDRSAVSF